MRNIVLPRKEGRNNLANSRRSEKESVAGARERREFARRMEERRWEQDAELRKILGRGWRLGAEDFLDRLEDRIQSQLTDDHDRQQVAETMELRAARLVEQELQELKLTVEDLRKLRKGDVLKIRLAEKLHRETPMTLRWIAAALQMGSWHYVSHLLYQQRCSTNREEHALIRSDSFADSRNS